jgi:trk system potassium uptake protein TrkH
MIGYRAEPLVNITLMALIILGGIGFLVIKETFDLSQNRQRSRKRRRRLSLHSRLVFMTSAILIVGGALLIGLLEASASLKSMGAAEGFWVALFQSVTSRTAGFNSIDLNLFEVPTLFLIMFLMFVGASPGSCGGGIKTTSLALFVAIMHSRLKGNPHTNVFRRTLPAAAVNKTLTLVMTALLFIALAVFSLLAVQMQGLPAMASRGAFLEYAFEAVSAFATVGLSLGATAKLVPAGKLIVILLMFIGRIGLLTVAFTMIQRSRKAAVPVHYAEENIMIG